MLGLCGGYQMLGKVIAIPRALNARPAGARARPADIETQLRRQSAGAGKEGAQNGIPSPVTKCISAAVSGRIAHGRCCISPMDAAMAHRPMAGVIHVHGLFTDAAQRSTLLARLGGKGSGVPTMTPLEAALDAVAAI